MTGPDLKAARETLGLTQDQFGALLRVPDKGRTVRRWENGERSIPGPVIVLTTLLLKCPPARKLLGLQIKAS
jgi:DNA-binding transcriptional regulator YiaG